MFVHYRRAKVTVNGENRPIFPRVNSVAQFRVSHTYTRAIQSDAWFGEDRSKW